MRLKNQMERIVPLVQSVSFCRHTTQNQRCPREGFGESETVALATCGQRYTIIFLFTYSVSLLRKEEIKEKLHNGAA